MSDELTLRGREILVNLLEGRVYHAKRDPDGKRMPNRNRGKSLSLLQSMVPTYVTHVCGPPILTDVGRFVAEEHRRRLTRRRSHRSRRRNLQESGSHGSNQNP